MNSKTSTRVWNDAGGYAEVLRVSWPLIISMGSFTMMQFADRMFLAWHSAVSIQAALPAGILSFTMICGFMALAGYANSFRGPVFWRGGQGRYAVAPPLRAYCSRSISWPIMLALIAGWTVDIASQRACASGRSGGTVLFQHPHARQRCRAARLGHQRLLHRARRHSDEHVRDPRRATSSISRWTTR